MDTLRKVMVVLTTLGTITVNALANALPINGQNTGEISDRFQVFFVPAGYVFAIWGVIYLGILAFAIYQALPAHKQNKRLERAGWWFVLGNLANGAWIFMWHYNLFPASLIFMLVLLISLIMVYLSLHIGREKISLIERWAVSIPVSIYLGWISVATIANVTDVLYDLGWNGAGIAPQVWAVIMLVVALTIGFLMAATRADTSYLLVFVWAFAGIGVKQAAFPLVANAAWIGSGVALFLALTAPLLQKRLSSVFQTGS